LKFESCFFKGSKSSTDFVYGGEIRTIDRSYVASPNYDTQTVIQLSFLSTYPGLPPVVEASPEVEDQL